MFKRMQGVTLVEALIVVLIAGILLSVATPGIKDFVRKNKTTAITNQMLSYLTLARSEAAKRGYNVVICVRNAAGNGCDASSKDFAQGVFIFVDYMDTTHSTNGIFDGTNIAYDLDSNGTTESFEEVILVTEPLTTSYTIVNNRPVTSTGWPPSALAYLSSGSVSPKNGSRIFSIEFKSVSDSLLTSKITFNLSGRARSCVVRPGESCA